MCIHFLFVHFSFLYLYFLLFTLYMNRKSFDSSERMISSFDLRFEHVLKLKVITSRS